jgi:hypothetical protein
MFGWSQSIQKQHTVRILSSVANKDNEDDSAVGR